jgi:hypothetical protein
MLDNYNYNYDNDYNREDLVNADNNKSNHTVDSMYCSQECCKFTQWLPPDLQQNDPKYKNFVGSNFTCNNGSGSGCVCIKQDDINFLANKAGNTMQNTCDN